MLDFISYDKLAMVEYAGKIEANEIHFHSLEFSDIEWNMGGRECYRTKEAHMLS